MKRFLKLAAMLAFVAVLAFLSIPLALQSSLHLERSIVVNAPPEKVFAIASDLANFSRWDQGMKTDPSMWVEVRGSGVGAEYEWHGKETGHGKVTILSLDSPRAVEGRLQFFEPMEDIAFVGWTFAPEGSGTRVTSSFDQEYTYLRRYFTLCVEHFLGDQLDRALADMKAEIEKR